MRKTIGRKLLLSTMTILGTAIVVFVFLNILNLVVSSSKQIAAEERLMHSNFDRIIKEQVQNATSVAKYYEALAASGQMTTEQAKEAAAEIIRQMRYGTDGYFWIDTTKGDNVVLLGNATEGTNRFEAKDANGFSFIKAIIENSKQPEGGFTDYYFPKAGQDIPLQKRGYALYFQPFDWVIGTGNYIDNIVNEIDALKKEVTTNLITGVVISISVMILFLLIGLFVSRKLARSISSPITTLVSVAEKVASGETNASFEHSDIFEISQLGSSFQAVINSIQSQADILRLVSQGDFTHSVAKRSDNDVLNESISTMSQLLNRTILEIRRIAGGVASGSNEVASSAQLLAQGATEQAASVEELSSSVANMQEQFKLTGENIVKITKDTDEVERDLHSTYEQMQNLMNEIVQVNSKSNEISKIIKTIEDIAFQTNILALNAAVEAARAGAAGKGFAVVADEVRNLAGKSAEAAKNTAALIESTVTSISAVTQNAEATVQTMDTINSTTKEVAFDVRAIAETVEKELITMQQISNGIGQISSVVQTNSATSEESAAASVELSSQANMLREMVAKFRTNDYEAPFPKPNSGNLLIKQNSRKTSVT